MIIDSNNQYFQRYFFYTGNINYVPVVVPYGHFIVGSVDFEKYHSCGEIEINKYVDCGSVTIDKYLNCGEIEI